MDTEIAAAVAPGRSLLAAEIRLAWWAEELDRLAGGGGETGTPPMLRALRQAGQDAGLFAALARAVRARSLELDPRPFASPAALLDHLAEADGAVLEAALRTLAPPGGGGEAAAAAAGLLETGRGLGLHRLHAELALWRGTGRDPRPPDADAAPADAWLRRQLGERLPRVRREIAELPSRYFPAVAAGVQLSAAVKGRELSALALRWRMLRGALSGRV